MRQQIAILLLVSLRGATGFIPGLPRAPGVAPSPHSSRRGGPPLTRVQLFGLKQLFGGGGKPPEQKRQQAAEELGEAVAYGAGVWGKSVPSMDDLWREAWPMEACQAMMKMKEEMNTGTGPPHFDHGVRTFSSNETSYNIFYRDSSAWCPYCQSVWMLLEEKRLPYKVKKVNLLAYGDKPDWFFRVSPSGLLPVLEVDGRIVRESGDIMRLVDWWRGSMNQEKLYPPKGSDLQQEAEALLVLERDLFREWFIWLFEAGPGPEEEERGRDGFVDTLDKVETALGVHAGPWFLGGASPSLVDCAFAPKVERMVASVLYFKGLPLRHNPRYNHLNRWLDALEHRPSYAAFKSDYYTINQSLQPMFGRAYATVAGQAYRDAIDGKGGAWRLPVTWSDDDVEYVPADLRPREEYTRQAVAVKLIVGHKRVPRYMLRALGRAGQPSVRSSLSDPFNEGGPEAVLAGVEAAYRWLILALLRGADQVEAGLAAEIRAADRSQGEVEAGRARRQVALCLDYLRDRVGVPRDMSLPEARQLRAHLNWLADRLRQQPAP